MCVRCCRARLCTQPVHVRGVYSHMTMHKVTQKDRTFPSQQTLNLLGMTGSPLSLAIFAPVAILLSRHSLY